MSRMIQPRLLVVVLMGITTIAAANAETRHVPGEYGAIPAAVDDATNGETVLVADGSYTDENNRGLNSGGRLITVRSENGARTSGMPPFGSHRGAIRGISRYERRAPHGTCAAQWRPRERLWWRGDGGKKTRPAAGNSDWQETAHRR